MGDAHYPGTGFGTDTSLDDCRTACVDYLPCVGIDHDEQDILNIKCYLLEAGYQRYTNPSVVFYKLEDRCPTGECINIHREHTKEYIFRKCKM